MVDKMLKRLNLLGRSLSIAIVVFGVSNAYAQKDKPKPLPQGKAILWQSVDIPSRDLFAGPGGESMRPDLSHITFIKQEKGGHNKKYRIKDGSGRIWVAKPGSEARPETASVRLLYGLGYVTEINYLVPKITIPSVGTLENVRLEARPENIKRLDPWSWEKNPFVGSNELQGLKIMQIFLTNYDLLDLQNQTLEVQGPSGTELHYIISDLGSTIGKLGSNNIPIFFRMGRNADNPEGWSKAKFIDSVENGHLVLATTGAKSRGLFKDITVAQGRWLFDLLAQLTDKQLSDAFRAANYSPEEVNLLIGATKRRIGELGTATRQSTATGMNK